MNWLEFNGTIIFAGILLDYIIGDPQGFPHPVRAMGMLIAKEEEFVRRFSKSDLYLRIGGLLIVLLNLSLGFALPYLIIEFTKSYPALQIGVGIYFSYSCLAARDLHKEAMEVVKATEISLNEGRHRLSYIVGRDTDKLSLKQIYRATVETVSENTSDGVIGPMLFLMLLGVPGGMMYKFGNTMDSMLGYNNEKYSALGFFPAKTDDLLNLIPSRLSGALMIISSAGKFDIKNGIRIMMRDSMNHKSPNSGWPESAVAGLLGIRLGGGSYYHGTYVSKKTIGDDRVEIDHKHINETIEIMYRTQLLLMVLWIILIISIK